MAKDGGHTRHRAPRALAVLLSVALAAGLVPCAAAPALADDDDLDVEDIALDAEEAEAAVEEAELTLDEAEERMETLAAECEELQEQIDELQEQIDEMAASVLEAQDAMLQGREALGETAAYQYRWGGIESILGLLLSSESFGDLLRNISYLSAIMDYQAAEVVAQQERVAAFESISSQLSAQKDEQEEKLSELEGKVAEAEELVETATANLSDAEDEQDRIAALQAAAEALAAEDEVSEPVAVEEATTVDRQSVVSDDTEVIGDPSDEEADDADDSSDDADDADADDGSDDSDSDSDDSGSTSSSYSESDGWQTGIASAYGGSTDPYTPNPGITATGAVCDDTSMGVAIPMSWSNYWQYYGHTVEIYYNGTTVYATINDCGYLSGGARSLDLQPGVWKAFGYTSCTDWGLRTVRYRIL